MYERFFGLNKNPFTMTPDPNSLFLTQRHREALAGLSYGALNRKGFVVLVGEAGTGKTTLLRRLMEMAPETGAVACFVFNPMLTPAEFLELVLHNFGLTNLPENKAHRLLRFEQFLADTHRLGRTPVLIVDEAHKVSHEVFEEIRLLTNYETGDEKLLQIMLAGQPEINEVLNRPNLWQLKQRVAVRLRIEPLTAEQVRAYVSFRWGRFASTAQPFDNEALSLLARWSRGIPRLVNSICDNALLSAFGDETRRVSAAYIREAVSDLDLPEPLEEEPSSHRVFAPPPRPVEPAPAVRPAPAPEPPRPPVEVEPEYGTRERMRAAAPAPAAVAEPEENPVESALEDSEEFADAILMQADEELPPEPDVPHFGYSEEPHVPLLVRVLARLGVFSVRSKDGREIL